MQIAFLQKLRHNCVLRLTNIFAACNSHEHHAIPKTNPKLKDALQDLNCLNAEIRC